MRVAIAILALTACGGSREAGYDYASSRGAAAYREMCQSCHGETGEGGLGPKLLDTERSVEELRSAIATRMPANNPGQCSGTCADDVAAFISEGLTTSALRCDDAAPPPAPRRLRLLTRREYRATVADVFGSSAPALACGAPTACAFRDTCDAGACRPTACDTVTFAWDPKGRAASRVHVAGSFNGWAATVAAGGLALVRDPASGVWSGTFVVGAGMHQYKLVLDERDWITDPRAPAMAPDGFGGQNGAFALACNDPANAIPGENRRAGFPFDSDADTAVVTAMHVDAYLASAEALADHAATRAADIVGCTGECAIGKLGRRLFRRSLTGEELAQYQALAATGLATALHAMLVSPHFLYRSELGAEDDGRYRLTGPEIATALAYAFVGSTPSDELIAAAERGELADAAGIERWARTLVADPRARAQVGELALQWIGGQQVLTVDKRADMFPGFDTATRRALADETRRFAASVAFDGSGTFDELLVADYTILDATSAAFYGAASTGRVHLDGRAGVLGHAAMLATTAHSDQTSPIRRGLLVRRNLLCEELPPPPPFAGAVPEVTPGATTRERFAQHTANEVCAGCHRFIDGLGFAFEHFDAVGRWRTSEGGRPIDASGALVDVERLGAGTSADIASIPGLARQLADSSAARSCFVRQYLRFSRGALDTLANRCDRLWVEKRFEAAGRDIRELMVQAALSPSFVLREPERR